MPVPRRVIIHGHFYQPPREDPWLEEIPAQKGAAPWHDWNEKIDRECYRAVVAARVIDGNGKIARVVNTLAHMSFDVGPTLFEWMERCAPATYAAILEADRLSIARTGHGGAMAQPYHHVILPLASRRDKVTEVRWGIADFTRRFGRAPEGMWLPETAVDDETLDVLAQEGITFTVVAPNQVDAPPPNGLMGNYTTENGRSIAIAVYDGNLSHGVAFGRLLVNARLWKSEIMNALEAQDDPTVISIATDGETYGHHHHFSEMALAWLLSDLEETPGIVVTNYAALLAERSVEHTVRIVSPSSWSCEHGVERWRSNCGCRVATELPARQEWRAGLRDGLEALRAELDIIFEREGAAYFPDPWAARDAYGPAMGAEPGVRRRVIASLLRPGLSEAQRVRASELLELERDALRMFTSCAWFFDDVTGLEPAQNLRYAARAIELAGASGAMLEQDLLAHLRLARSSEPGSATGEDVWARDVSPLVAPLVRLAGGAAAAHSCVPEWAAPATPAFDLAVDGRRVTLTQRRTGRIFDFDAAVRMQGIASVHTYVRELSPSAMPGTEAAALMAGTVPVMLNDFPERERDAVRAAIRVPQRHDLARRLLGNATLARVANGDITLIDATITALIEQVTGITDDPSPERDACAREMVDLLELLGHGIPFDVQTEFAVAVGHLPPASRGVFQGLATRLGFAPGFLEVAGEPVGSGLSAATRPSAETRSLRT